MILFLWIAIFIASLAVLVKSADWLLDSAEKIGLAAGLSPFIIGVTIVGLGTSFPELITAVIAVLKGASEIVSATAIGSNVSNILLILGISAIVAGRLSVTKNIIDLDLPLLAVGTVLFLGVIWDRQVVFFESILLLIAYIIYLLYTVIHRDDEEGETLPSRETRRRKKIKTPLKPKLVTKDFILLFVGIAGLIVGAKYMIDAMLELSVILNIGAGVIAITAAALGTSLPELVVSLKAALNKKSEIAIGNIFGSNIFNMFVVVGIPGLISTIKLDGPTFAVGAPAVALVTLLFVISGISRRIHAWEGAIYLLVYILFIAKILNLF